MLLIGATLATLSRGALVGLAALAPWAILTRRVPLTGVLLGVVTIVSVAGLAFALWAPILNDRLSMKSHIADKNVDAREALWTGAVRMAADRPFTGVGPGRFGIESSAYVRNNPVPLGEDRWSTTRTCTCSPRSACSASSASSASSPRPGGCSRAGVEERSASGIVAGQRLATAMQASLIVAIVAGGFLSEQFTTPFWMIGALATVVAGVPQAVRVTGPRAALQPAAAASG